MYQQKISFSASTEIFLDRIDGDLQVMSWDRPEALVESASKEDLSITQQNNELRIDCRDDCSIYLPFTANIYVGHVGGDARFNHLESRLQIDQIDGSAIFHKVNEVQLNTVAGDLMANKIAGNLIIDQAHGDAIINRLEKGCAIQKVSGGLQLYDIKGHIFACAEGDVCLRQTDSIHAGCEISSGGDIRCQMPDDIDARITLKSHSNSIHVHLGSENMHISEPEKTLTIGSGTNPILLTAEGEITFSNQDHDQQTCHGFEAGFDVDFQNISKTYLEQLESQFEKQMDLLNSHMEKLSETLSSLPIPGVEIDHIVERARRSSAIAAQRAQEKMERTQRKLEQKVAEAKRKSGIKSARHSHGRPTIHIQWDAKPKSSTPVGEPISPDERLMVLKMLEEKKISLDEAENLLRALEGQEE